MSLTPEQIAKVSDWYSTKAQLDSLKEAESILRKSVIEMLSQTAVDASGTETIECPDGWQLKIVKGLDYKLDNKDGKLDKALEQFSDGTAALLVKWEPKLSVSAFKSLPEDEQVKIYDCLTIKPSSPQVELKPPKAK